MAESLPEQESHIVGDAGGGAVPVLVREPQQDRSRRTLQRILDAALYILEHDGAEALTVTGITKRARTSVGSFYARFEGKDDLLRYLGERSLNEAIETWTQLTEGFAPGAGLRGAVSDVVQRLGWLYLEGAGRFVMLLDGVEDPPPSRRQRLEDQIAKDIRDLQIAPVVRSDLSTRVLTGILQDAAIRALRANVNGEDAESPYPEAAVLLSELVEVLVGYLGGEVRTPAASLDTKLTPPLELAKALPAAPSIEPEPKESGKEPAAIVAEVEASPMEPVAFEPKQPPATEPAAEPQLEDQDVAAEAPTSAARAPAGEPPRADIDTEALIELATGSLRGPAPALEPETEEAVQEAEPEVAVEETSVSEEPAAAVEEAEVPREPAPSAVEPEPTEAPQPEPPETAAEVPEPSEAAEPSPPEPVAEPQPAVAAESPAPEPEPEEEEEPPAEADPFDVWG